MATAARESGRYGASTGEGVRPSGSVSIAERQGRSHARALGHALLALALIAGPVLAPADAALAAKKKAATPSVAAAIVVDMNSGSILQEQAADTPRHPASLTKMMTLYVLFGYLQAGKLTPSSDSTVTAHAATQAPTKLGLKPGATIKVNDAIKALVTQSANDAAVTIAENLAGTEENFAKLMTDTARQIGMTQYALPQRLGPARRRADHHGARHGDSRGASDPRLPGLLHGVLRPQYFTFNGRKYRNHNKLLFNYQGHRRHQDRLYAGKRLQPRGLRASRRTSISSPSCSAARPAASATPPCARCSRRILSRRRPPSPPRRSSWPRW